MADKFNSYADSVSAPSRDVVAVSPNDTTALANIPKAIRIGTAGTVVLRAVDSSADVTILSVAAGETLPIRAQYIRATGTTAGSIIAFY